MSERETAEELLARPHALLIRTHLRDLGLGRAAIDAVFRELEVIVFPGSLAGLAWALTGSEIILGLAAGTAGVAVLALVADVLDVLGVPWNWRDR